MASITIIDSKPVTGELTLSDQGHTRAQRKETILWKLGPNCGVKTISNIYPKKSPPSNNIFSELPHRAGSSDNWKAVVHKKAHLYADYNYSIFWIPKNSDQIKEHDPKISVKPTTFNLFKLILIVLSSIFSIFLFTEFFKRVNRVNEDNDFE